MFDDDWRLDLRRAAERPSRRCTVSAQLGRRFLCLLAGCALNFSADAADLLEMDSSPSFKRLRLRRADRCFVCGLELDIGQEALWYAGPRVVSCAGCQLEPPLCRRSDHATRGGGGTSIGHQCGRCAVSERCWVLCSAPGGWSERSPSGTVRCRQRRRVRRTPRPRRSGPRPQQRCPSFGNPKGHFYVPPAGRAVDTRHPNHVIGNGLAGQLHVGRRGARRCRGRHHHLQLRAQARHHRDDLDRQRDQDPASGRAGRRRPDHAERRRQAPNPVLGHLRRHLVNR